MTLKFSNIPKFKKEVLFFESEIQKIKNVKLKEKARALLDEIYKETNLIDESYQVELNPDLNPRSIMEHRDNILDLRRQLHSLFKNLKST